jgi:hypothetical protein
MTRNHFANYAKNNPKEYAAFSDNLWNGFVTVTHKVGLSKFFTFTPDFTRGLDAEAIGKQLGTVYELAQGSEEQHNHSSLYK